MGCEKAFGSRPRHPVRCLLVAVLLCLWSGSGSAALAGVADPDKDIGRLDKLEIFQTGEPSLLYSVRDEPFAHLAPEYRIYVPLERIPKTVRDAFLAAEDAEFYTHGAISLKGMARAALRNLTSARLREGGSTITQQLAKTLFLSPERTMSRKLKEIQLAREIEQRYSKDKIFEMYLNAIYLGGGAYGVEAAARVYFGRSLSQLSLAEAATLAGLPKAPSLYSPLQNPAKAKARRDYVLSRMEKEGFIRPAQAQAALRQPLVLTPLFKERGHAGAFVDYVRGQLEQTLGRRLLARRGLRVYTTLDLTLQKAATESLQRGLAEIERRQAARRKSAPPAPAPPLEGALVALDPASGEIRAMVGGRDYARSEFNRAVQARRQPGSAFKPFVYAAALDHGFTPATLLEDFPVSYSIPQNGQFVEWSPDNYDHEFRGQVTLRRALEESINVPTVRLLEQVGMEPVVSLARRMGIGSELRREYGLALGVSEVTLLEMTSAYGVLANRGVRVPPRAIRRILFPDGRSDERSEPGGQRVLSEEIAFQMTSLLQGAVERGTARRAKVPGRPVAAKTGTAQEAADLWLVGYVPELAVGLWVGYDKPRSLGFHETAGQLVAPIWAGFMRQALERLPSSDWPIPEGLFTARVNRRTGLPTDPGDPDGITEYFRRGEPELPAIGEPPLREIAGDTPPGGGAYILPPPLVPSPPAAVPPVPASPVPAPSVPAPPPRTPPAAPVQPLLTLPAGAGMR
jgi:penicillin-binding protein 1A